MYIIMVSGCMRTWKRMRRALEAAPQSSVSMPLLLRVAGSFKVLATHSGVVTMAISQNVTASHLTNLKYLGKGREGGGCV